MKIGISSMIIKTVKSINLCKSVIQTILSYDIVKAHGGEIKVETIEIEVGVQLISNILYAR